MLVHAYIALEVQLLDSAHTIWCMVKNRNFLLICTLVPE